MKILYAAFCIAFISFACGGGGDSDSVGGYKLQPGSLSKYSEVGDFSVNWGGPLTGKYAIIYKGTVGGTPYVGISIDVDGDPATAFNCKMYFNAASVPVGTATYKKDENGFKIVINSNQLIDAFDDSIELNFEELQSDNTITIKTGANNSIRVGSNDLTITTIKAYYISGN